MLKAIVAGQLGKDATVNKVGSTNVINFSVAHSERFTDKQGNKQEKTTWVEVAKWGEKIGLAPYLKKGTSVVVEGIPEARAYMGKDGKAASSLTLRATDIQLLGGKSDSGGSSSSSSPYSTPAIPDGGDNAANEPLPF